VTAESSVSGVTVGVTRAHGAKCGRCWLYCTSVGMHAVHSDVCLRCADVLKTDGHEAQ
jgi:isoleucyl-tRNA synthetase